MRERKQVQCLLPCPWYLWWPSWWFGFLFQSDGLMSESESLLLNSVGGKAEFREVSCVFSVNSFIASRLMFLHSLDLKGCDHSLTNFIIAAVIYYYKFSQPSADYWQSILYSATFNASCNILLVCFILTVYRKLRLVFLTDILRPTSTNNFET